MTCGKGKQSVCRETFQEMKCASGNRAKQMADVDFVRLSVRLSNGLGQTVHLRLGDNSLNVFVADLLLRLTKTIRRQPSHKQEAHKSVGFGETLRRSNF